MRVSVSGLKSTEGKSRLEAEVAWETSPKRTVTLFYEVDANDSDVLPDSVDPFLVATLVPAIRHGERRLVADSATCPVLLENLRTMAAYRSHWMGGAPIDIDAPSERRRATSSRVASFMSGGLDSAFTLRSTLSNFPLGHPARVTDAVMVYGFDIGDKPGDGEAGLWESATRQVSAVAADAGVGLLLLRTNIKRALDTDTYFWMHQFHGAAVASVAHAISGAFNRAYIASTFDVPNLEPWGSHPLTDHLATSSVMSVSHHGERYSRLEKLRTVAQWPAALNALRICSKDPEGRNCEKCEKCLRTITEFEALGILGDTETFRMAQLSASALAAIRIRNAFQAACFEELVAPLERRGREDLARVIRSRLRRYALEGRLRSTAKTLLRRH